MWLLPLTAERPRCRDADALGVALEESEDFAAGLARHMLIGQSEVLYAVRHQASDGADMGGGYPSSPKFRARSAGDDFSDRS